MIREYNIKEYERYDIEVEDIGKDIFYFRIIKNYIKKKEKKDTEFSSVISSEQIKREIIKTLYKNKQFHKKNISKRRIEDIIGAILDMEFEKWYKTAEVKNGK